MSSPGSAAPTQRACSGDALSVRWRPWSSSILPNPGLEAIETISTKWLQLPGCEPRVPVRVLLNEEQRQQSVLSSRLTQRTVMAKEAAAVMVLALES